MKKYIIVSICLIAFGMWVFVSGSITKADVVINTATSTPSNSQRVDKLLTDITNEIENSPSFQAETKKAVEETLKLRHIQAQSNALFVFNTRTELMKADVSKALDAWAKQ